MGRLRYLDAIPQNRLRLSGVSQKYPNHCERTTMMGNGGNKTLVADVPSWLKSLRLHKYTTLFQQLSYDQMMALNEVILEKQVLTSLFTRFSRAFLHLHRALRKVRVAKSSRALINCAIASTYCSRSRKRIVRSHHSSEPMRTTSN